MPKTRKWPRIVLVVFILSIPICFRGYYQAQLWKYMAPYNALARRNATESEVIHKFGKPHIVISTDAELHAITKDFKPYGDIPKHLGSKVIVYYADPWHDSEGYVVYLFINHRGRVDKVALGG
ncbi:MAG: hypothetical protein ABFD54_11545 [Armatimonadota bacterium]|nr:hypothetical protein [bacterium]